MGASPWRKLCHLSCSETLARGLGKSRAVSAGNHGANQSNSTFIRLEGDFKTCHFPLEEIGSLVTSCGKYLVNKDRRPRTTSLTFYSLWNDRIKIL